MIYWKIKLKKLKIVFNNIVIMDFKKKEYSSNELNKLKLIINELEDFKKDIDNIDYIHNKTHFFDLMKNFRKYIAWLDSEMFEVFYHSKYFNIYENYFTSTHEYYLRSLESIQSLSVMTKWIHNFASITELLDWDVIKESFNRKAIELESINFENVNNFLFAWCGPFPETMLYVYENTEIENILWLDYNHEAIYMAWEMVNWLSMDNINLKQIDATEFDYKDIDAVSIPLFVNKKSEVINRIIETWKDNIQIIVASPKWFMNLIYKWIWKNLSPRAKITYREDLLSTFVNQEIIKIEKYDF